MNALWWNRPGFELGNIVFSEDEARLRRAVDLTVLDGGTAGGPEAVIAASAGKEIVISGWGPPPYPDEVLAGCPDLRLIVRMGGSIRKVIGDSAWARGIRVVTAVDGQGQMLADLVLTLTLAGLHQIPFYVRQQWGVEPLRVAHGTAWPQHTLHGKRVGIYGFGAIGQHVARLLRPWDCPLLAFDPFVSDAVLDRHHVARAESLAALCAASDVLVVVVADTAQTIRSVGADELARLHDGALVVNVSRSEIVQIEALEVELRRGRLFACFDNATNDLYNHPERLRYLPNFLLTPSICTYSDGIPLLMGRQVVDEVLRYIQGEPLQHEVRQEQLGTRA